MEFVDEINLHLVPPQFCLMVYLEKLFTAEECVRQGDPLSPLLYVLASDLLQSMINNARVQGLLNLPIPLQHSQDFPILQYADDTLVIMEVCPNQIATLQNIVQDFSTSTDLKLVPINLEAERATSLAQQFGCIIGTLPFTYLGLPLGLSKPKVVDFLPLVSRCERILPYTSSFLSQAGRLEITNSFFTSFPMFFMSTFRLHKKVIQHVDSYRKHSLWRGANINDKRPSKAAWELVCLRKAEGGLGALNLQTQNEALLLKNLHKFFNGHDIPRVNLIWERYYSNGSLPSTSQRHGSF